MFLFEIAFIVRIIDLNFCALILLHEYFPPELQKPVIETKHLHENIFELF